MTSASEEDMSRRRSKVLLIGGWVVLMITVQVVSRIPEFDILGRFVPVLWTACGGLGVAIITTYVLESRLKRRPPTNRSAQE
jgi:hypothetical protein